jgi:DNA-binding transcriptional ArsR family regulator
MTGRDRDQALLEALRHPLRRALLRRYLQSERALSPRELAVLEGQSLSGTSYHVRVLLQCGAIESRALGHHSAAFTLSRYTHLLPGDEARR